MTTVAMNTQLRFSFFYWFTYLLSTVWTIERCLRNQQLFHMLCCRDNIVGVWTKYEYFRQVFAKVSNIKWDPNSPSGSRDDKADRQTDMIWTALSGIGRRSNFAPPPPPTHTIRTDRLTIFTANRKDWPSFSEWPRLRLLPLISKSTNNDTTKNTKIYAK
jgi:hypothetical protein